MLLLVLATASRPLRRLEGVGLASYLLIGFWASPTYAAAEGLHGTGSATSACPWRS
jgi:NADH:ubiquinone oxidoreductase subunit 5 (subunit L)/multisubunit Na+/H+ antiporter MnhA subunit